jgi:CxxC motif-containing protein (DUF1111 family)
MERTAYRGWGLFGLFCLICLGSAGYVCRQIALTAAAEHEQRTTAAALAVAPAPSESAPSHVVYRMELPSFIEPPLPLPQQPILKPDVKPNAQPAASVVAQSSTAPGAVLAGQSDLPILVPIAADPATLQNPVTPGTLVAETAFTRGQELFTHRWTPHDPLSGGGDGLGPVFNGYSCVECHFQGGMGGSGTNEHSVRSFEILPKEEGGEVISGVVHAFAIMDRFKETTKTLEDVFQPGKVHAGQRSLRQGVVGEFRRTRELDATRLVWINTPSLWGIGLIDRVTDHQLYYLPRAKHIHVPLNSQEPQNSQAIHLKSAAIDAVNVDTMTGRFRNLPKGRIGKFGWKGQFATLHDFVAAACANELGLTNAYAAQVKPCEFKPDTNASLDLTTHQVDDLVEFVRGLPPPQQTLPDDPALRGVVSHGALLFKSIGCANCHTKDVGPAKGVYSDFKLHKVVNELTNVAYYMTENLELEIQLPADFPQLTEWKTPPLWGVADTAPYWHDGSAKTLEQAILLHANEAKPVTEAYRLLRAKDQESLISFLETLHAPADLPKDDVAAR